MDPTYCILQPADPVLSTMGLFENLDAAITGHREIYSSQMCWLMRGLKLLSLTPFVFFANLPVVYVSSNNPVCGTCVEVLARANPVLGLTCPSQGQTRVSRSADSSEQRDIRSGGWRRLHFLYLYNGFYVLSSHWSNPNHSTQSNPIHHILILHD